MATSNAFFQLTFIAGADLSAKQYFAVKKDTASNQVVLAGAGDAVLGILQNKPTQGQAALVLIYGETPVVAGSTDITEGALAASDASGKTVTAGSGAHAYGICRQPGDHTSGALATVLLIPQGIQ